MNGIPLGQKESENLEFKGASALEKKKLNGIAREAVAMLNAKGGEIWVGIAESSGYAVRVESIEGVEVQRSRLRDALIDLIEPAPTSDEVGIEVVQDDDGRSLIRVSVRPEPGRRPYAVIEGTARHYVIRVGDRIRPMNRDEILKPSTTAKRRGEVAAAVQQELRKRRDDVRKSEGSAFLMQILPQTNGIDIKLNARIREFLQNAESTGNRPDGWNFANRYVRPELRGECMVMPSKIITEIWEDGRVISKGPMEVLHHGQGEKVVWPYAISEYPVSLMRLASVLYADGVNYRDQVLPETFPILVDVALLGARGWKLCPYPPGTCGFMFKDEGGTLLDEDVVRSRPFQFSSEEVKSDPDRCGQRIVRWLYQEFGHDEDKLLPNFDRKTGRLSFDR